ncbi:hypothetical protein EVJ58_g1928 [Rhodofomes roseus]|uniref:Uncharacterized protein n=1 Tax=Rhodofomes roseus TaxID=34475 RepID=A0A4Y9YV07_9APHY|nr:hypothetical protein EVJ58_g1928 [Rhodofomes roseus]
MGTAVVDVPGSAASPPDVFPDGPWPLALLDACADDPETTVEPECEEEAAPAPAATALD